LDDWDLVVMVPIVDPPDGHRARALNAAQNMLACTEQSVPWRGSAITPSASVGVALWPHQGATFGELLRRCDAALYDAQARGGKRIRLYSESAYLQRADRWTRIQDLGEAMKQGQLEMHYQPIHDGRTGGLIGLEGLVRWRQLDGTLILPGDFVPLAEESDLIMDLGYWTVATAIEDLGWMARAGLSTPFLSLNVSPRQLVGDVFVTQVSTLLRNAGIAPGRIHIEITETSLVEGFERTRRLLARMGDAGLRVYVDDFGVGYSSLSYLRELPIHGLKIDKSFVENIGRTDQDETVLGTVLKLADGLGLDIIAEGVETTYQKQFLLERDCHRLQGHLFALPMPREALVTYARGDYAARLETA
ncbi:MAG: GGDEF domain-containing phosphodiesterase, partial [Pseudomonadota bacterium]